MSEQNKVQADGYEAEAQIYIPLTAKVRVTDG